MWRVAGFNTNDVDISLADDNWKILELHLRNWKLKILITDKIEDFSRSFEILLLCYVLGARSMGLSIGN